ncbi:Ig-like domain-containing protein [Litorilituus lipolyticus]|uniref:Big-1 domain-containing protein n=1 Tax=Litorilituus lipolyticus TaxID=2491017 RepID=A0A502KX83_9GAMM|nr:Ig-like domain-containing protein [Litorilituus lipolyticus]TPH15029.1 hypothetical protein EPA86_09410 [Litorilituus lipolyticus]
MRKLSFLSILFYLALLTGCNGHTDNGDSSTPNAVASIQFSLLDSQGNTKQSFNKNEAITLQAKLLDKNNAIVANKAVAFAATIGTLTVSSKLSDSNGIAIVTLTNENGSLGAGIAGAAIGDVVSNTIEFEFIDTEVPSTSPKITSAMMLNGEAVNQFKADQQVQLIATLTDENDQVMANQLVSFTADIGTVSPATALTNAQGIASVNLSSDDEQSIGAGVVSASFSLTNDLENATINSTFNYQILPADAIVDSDIRLGYFDDNENFIEGQIKLSIDNNQISAGGTLGLSVDLVDETGARISSPVPVSFTSNCVQNENASIDASVLSINGTASSTFEDISCAGATGTDDVILATVALNGITSSASETITISGEQLGSIEFISAEPNAIVLKGTGGQNKQETSTLTFKVKSDLGNILPQQAVDFTLSTTAGGITLSRSSGLTNSQGLVTTQVSAGSVPTAVRVTATATMDIDGASHQVQTQSDLLSINTGLAEQRSMTIAASVLNPEAHNYSGEKSTITAWLSDNFNNPVPDGTTVNFTTEGGLIEPSCSTVNGSCSVEWESAEPRVADHRVTILATALGHETFFDTNGNNVFDDNDGSAISADGNCKAANVASGFGNIAAQSSGFIDMSEAWRDDNENCTYEVGEKFIDFNNDNVFNNEDVLFNGPQCQGDKCADEAMQSSHVRKALVLVMASSSAEYYLTDDLGTTIYEQSSGASTPIPDISDGASKAFIFSFADTGIPNQTMPLDTQIAISANAGDLQGNTNAVVTNNAGQGFSSMEFWLSNEAGGSPTTAIITITITTPKGHVTSMITSVELL